MLNVTDQEIPLVAIDSVFAISLSLFGLAGNVFIIGVFIQLDLTATILFVLHLAILDLLTCICALFKQIFYFLGVLSSNDCCLLQFFLYISTSAIPFLLLAIAIDRYRRVCQVHRWQISLNHAKIVMVVTMLMSTILSLPILFFYQLHDPSRENRMCEIQHKTTFSFIYFVVLFVLLLSTTVPITLYYKQVCQAVQILSCKQADRAQRSTFTMSGIAIVFLLSYFPCLLVDVLDQKIEISTNIAARIFHCLATRSYLFSCTFNPIFYGCRDKRSRELIKAAFQNKPTDSKFVPVPEVATSQ